MIFVRDLIEHLGTHPPEAKLRLQVVCLNGEIANADDYQMRRGEDGVMELRISGALVELKIREPEPAQASANHR